MSTREMVAAWLDSLRPGTVRELFEYLPNMLYFAKDTQLHLMAGNRAFVQRCGFESEEELIGKLDHEIFPTEMAEKFNSDDRKVLESGHALTGIVELFPNAMGDLEWFVTDKVSVTQLATLAKMSVRQLERRFRETFKMTPMQYVTKRRILHACDLLSGTTLQITEIALETGFYDHSSFSKKFSEIMGAPPSAYRQRFKREE